MDAEVQKEHTATITVEVSTRSLALHDQKASSSAELLANLLNKIIVLHIIAKRNFAVVGENRYEIDPPALDEDKTLYFDVKAAALGQGEILVVARQGPAPLLTLTLNPLVVESRSPSIRITKDVQVGEQPEKYDTDVLQLTIFEREIGNTYGFTFLLQKPSLGLNHRFESENVNQNKLDYVSGLYKEIEKFYPISPDEEEEMNLQLRAYGGELFDQLFPAPLQELLWSNRADLKGIMVISDEPFVPWEIVHLKSPGDIVPDESLFLADLGLVRWIYGSWPRQNFTVRRGFVGFVIPQYEDTDLFLEFAEQEAVFFKDRFSAVAVTPTIAGVRHAITSPGTFDLLHFACHGDGDLSDVLASRLTLEGKKNNDAMGNEYYRPTYLSASMVKQLANFSGNPIVSLNACSAGRSGYNLTGIGGFAQAFLKRSAGIFIGALLVGGGREC